MNLDAGLILDPLLTPFVHPRSNSHMTRSATSGGPTPIWEGHPFVALQLADDDPQGQNVQAMQNRLRQTAFVNTSESERFLQDHLDSTQSKIPTQQYT